MINISFKYILTDKMRIETYTGKIIYVLAPQSLHETIVLKERTYKFVCGQAVYETICPEMQDDKTKYLVIPKLLIPSRPYPIYVYLYGILLYSSNPQMGQREAAEITRKHFDLETFSHTTLGRAIKKLEVRIKGFENKPHSEESSSEYNGCFPCVEHTRKRRDTVISFLAMAAGQAIHLTKDALQLQRLNYYKRPPYKGAFIDMCHRIVERTFMKYHSLLL